MAKPKFKKHVVKGKVSTRDHRTFTVKKSNTSEREVQLRFPGRVAYSVVKLSVNGLPRRDKRGKRITWINNWGVVTASGKYVSRVSYTVLLFARQNARFVYYDKGQLKENKKPVYRGHRRRGQKLVEVSFTIGDPPIGWT